MYGPSVSRRIRGFGEGESGEGGEGIMFFKVADVLRLVEYVITPGVLLRE